MKLKIKDSMSWKERFVYEKIIWADGFEMNQDGVKVQEIKFKPNSEELKPHFHKVTTELFYILKGEGTITMTKQGLGKVTEIKAKEGTVVLCEPYDIHSFVNDSSEDWIVLDIKTNEIEDDIYWI